MIKVEYEVDKSVPSAKELILFDRNAFQCLSKDVLLKVSKIYNILCPNIFVIECISPNNSDNKDLVVFEKEKNALREKLASIENPIVFTGLTNVSYGVHIPTNIKNNEYTDILFYWQIARNIIRNSQVTMKRVSPQELISKCKHKIMDVKSEIRESTKTIDENKGEFSPKKYISQVHRENEIYYVSHPMSEIKRELNSDPSTHITQGLSNVCGHVLREITNEPKDEFIVNIKDHFGLDNEDINSLRYQIKNKQKITIENYQRLSYPIYSYFLIRYMLYGRHQNTEHLDDSFFSDFQYLHYLNFCDRFIADETSTPHIVKAIPYSTIKDIPILTSEELTKELG